MPIRIWAAALIAVAAIGLAPQGALAQRYKQVQPSLKNADAKASYAKAVTIIRRPSQPSADDLTELSKFFNNYYALMTGYTPDQLARLEKMRTDLFRQFLNYSGGSPAARQHAVDITVKVMTSIAGNNYHPAVRYNAMMILAQLDKEPMGLGAGAAAPSPLPAATEALVAVLERDKPPGTIPSAVKVGALVGLERHTRFGADPQFADRITAAALSVATLKTQPEDVSGAVFDWMRSLSARVLTNQHAKGLPPAVADAVTQLLAAKELSLDDRCEVAKSLRPTMFPEAGGANLEAMSAALAQLARDVMRDESKHADDYTKEVFGEGGSNFSSFSPQMGGGGRGGYRGGMSEFGGGGAYRGGGVDLTTEEQGPTYERRRMLDRVLAIARAANAIKAGAAGSQELQERLTDLSSAIMEVANQTSKNDAVDAAVVKSVMKLTEDVNRIVASWPGQQQPAAAEQPADEFDAEEPPAEEQAGAQQAAAG